MKKKALIPAMLFAVVTSLYAQVNVSQSQVDSLHLSHLNEVVVSGVRTQKNAPYAVTNIKYKDLQAHSRTGRELPFLLAQTPGVVAWGENGLGTGTSYMRIRGAGDTRINVTLDGVGIEGPAR